MTRALDELRTDLNDLIAAWQQPEPEFAFRIGWSRAYEELLSNDFYAETEISALLEEGLKYGRVILHGTGGGAKTVILQRLARTVATRGDLGLWMDLGKWSLHDDESWARLTDRAGCLDLLLSRRTTPAASISMLTALARRLRTFLFVDGLNEMSSKRAQEVTEALSAFAARVPSSAVIVSDRIVRRELVAADHWQIARVLPLTNEQIRQRLTDARGDARLLDSLDQDLIPLLATPYYLDAALKGELSADTHAMYFRRHVKLTDEELRTVARAAFDCYRRTRSRTFPLSEFEVEASPIITEKLRQAGALVLFRDQRAQFAHHLKHDYLVGRHIAEDRNLWNDGAFDVATFTASSFEALAMALGVLSTTEDRDALVRRIYDWNFYGAVYAVAEERHTGSARVSREMEAILCLMLADRRWDLIKATVDRVTEHRVPRMAGLVPTPHGGCDIRKGNRSLG
jgi:hypothetical protein